MRRDGYKTFSPGKIANLPLKNRLVRCATFEAGATEDGNVTDGLLKFYKRLAEGGIGMILTGAMAVTPEGGEFHDPGCLWDDQYIDEIAGIAAVVHASGNGCKVLAQLGHGGIQNPACVSVGPSPAPLPALEKEVGQLSGEEIRNITKCFVEAILRVKKAGFDGVSARGRLLSSFLSAYTNRRADHYGGSTKKRVNIVREIVSSAREKVGDFPLLIEINCDDFVEESINMDTFHELAMELENAGVDAI